MVEGGLKRLVRFAAFDISLQEAKPGRCETATVPACARFGQQRHCRGRGETILLSGSIAGSDMRLKLQIYPTPPFTRSPLARNEPDQEAALWIGWCSDLGVTPGFR